MPRSAAFGALLACAFASACLAQGRTVADVLDARVAEHARARAVQTRIDAALGLAPSAADLLAAQQLGAALARAADALAAQRQRLRELEATVAAREQARAELIPLLHKMLDLLAQSVEQDLPVDLAARRRAIDRARARLSDATASAADRLSEVLSIYANEQRLAKSVAQQRGRIVLDGSERTVTLLRFGRVALYAVSDDLRHCAEFERAARAWVALAPARCRPLWDVKTRAPADVLSALGGSVESAPP